MGPATRQALIIVQRKHGLPENAEADAQTWSAIRYELEPTDLAAGSDPALHASPPSTAHPSSPEAVEEPFPRRPHAAPAHLSAGEVGPAVERTEEQVTTDLRRLLIAGGPDRVVWSEAGSEAIVHLGRTRAMTLPDGLMLIGISLETAESGPEPVELAVPFALGSARRLAGMLATTERRPRGPALLVDRWGEAVIATAWRALLDLAAAYAADSGRDLEGRPLVPAALMADPPRLTVVPRAMYAFEAG
jgi:hypothetical protein